MALRHLLLLLISRHFDPIRWCGNLWGTAKKKNKKRSHFKEFTSKSYLSKDKMVIGGTNGRRFSGSTGAAKQKPASSFEKLKPYGKHIFTGRLADYYLTKHGGSGKMFKDPSWVQDRKQADIVAAAVLDW